RNKEDIATLVSRCANFQQNIVSTLKDVTKQDIIFCDQFQAINVLDRLHVAVGLRLPVYLITCRSVSCLSLNGFEKGLNELHVPGFGIRVVLSRWLPEG
ncbi:hypothetical protein LOAG_12536, partial [Loa loa]